MWPYLLRFLTSGAWLPVRLPTLDRKFWLKNWHRKLCARLSLTERRRLHRAVVCGRRSQLRNTPCAEAVKFDRGEPAATGWHEVESVDPKSGNNLVELTLVHFPKALATELAYLK